MTIDEVEFAKRLVKPTIAITLCKNVGSFVSGQSAFASSEDTKDRKDIMWIACCGCGKPIYIPETTMLIHSDSISIRYKSTCPYCEFTHKITISKW